MSKSYVHARLERGRRAEAQDAPHVEPTIVGFVSHPLVLSLAVVLVAFLLALVVIAAVISSTSTDEAAGVGVAAVGALAALRSLLGIVLCVHATLRIVAVRREGERSLGDLVAPCLAAAIGVPLLATSTGAGVAAFGLAMVAAVVAAVALWRGGVPAPSEAPAVANGGAAGSDDAPDEDPREA